ncbi:MAG: metal ABC transporter solute-binding protein, Zn/Mn family [Parachlamydiaceae bacterium]
MIQNLSVLKFLLSLFLPLFLFSNSVIVSVLPHKFFVDKISGKTLEVIVMIPAGASPHTYEAPPKMVLAASQADIWFTIGEGFEKKAIDAIQANHALKVVDLRKGLDLIPAACCHGGDDLHIWMSLRLAEIQAKTIARALIEQYPDNKALYEGNLNLFVNELRALDNKISSELAPFKGRTVLVSHAAYGYFCRDYGINQLSIEVEGHEPTPKRTVMLLKEAKKLNISTIFVQPQYSVKGAEIFARNLNARLVALDPYAEDYLKSMEEIANAFKEAL